MNVIFDGNYLFHKTFSVFSSYFKDQNMSDVLNKKENREMLIRKLIIDFSVPLRLFNRIKNVIFVFDSYSWRYTIYENYKYALTKTKPDYYKEFLMVMEKFQDFLIKKGFIVSKIQGAEGDDLICIWSLYFGFLQEEETIIITGDSDITQLVSNKISVYCNNSKNLKFFCSKSRTNYWENKIPRNINIIDTDPFYVIIKKVILGDGSDNIISVKRGFGDKSFDRFIGDIIIDINYNNVDLLTFAEWITKRFTDYLKLSQFYPEYLEKIIFNLKLVWLNFSVYENNDFITESGKSLLKEMLDDINDKKDTYRYEGVYDIENIYGMLIK